MALFKLRKGSEESKSAARQPESVEAMRRRARHRLIGAAVLVLIGILGFPLLFDTQPRPIPVDIPIEIPDRNKAKPLTAPAPAAKAAPAAAAPPSAPATGSHAAVPAPAPTPAPAMTEARPAPQSESAKSDARSDAHKSESRTAKVEARPEPAKPESKPAEPKADKRPGDGAKALALLEGKSVSDAKPAAAEGRFVVQVGAFSEAGKARETRLKVEHAGLKTYTHVAETGGGKRIRVRVGPFATRAEAEKAAAKIKGLDLPAAILTL